MIIRLDFDSEIPIYTQIKDEIVKGIALGDLNDDDELPSVRGLAADIEVNMHTVNKAYKILKDEGYIRIDRRRGAVVSVNLEESTNRFMKTFKRDLEIGVIQCINRGIQKDKVKDLVEDLYSIYLKED
ncbi:MAG: GntR family transcriptional regulator [Clostridium sp.]